MVKPNQNMIHSSTVSLKYESKASASRCNILIESIFNSQILPELEKTISSNIPEEMVIELSKLEINIGSIPEKEITAHLANRIAASLEDALQNKIKIGKNSFTGNLTNERKSSNHFLIEFLEIFLQKGYFPFGMDESLTLDDLFIKTIRQDKNIFLDLIKKYNNYNAAIRRIGYNISSETFDLVLMSLDPVNFSWIIDYRKILINARKEGNIHQLSNDEFIRIINFLILKYMLNESGPTFIRKNFSDFILEKLMMLIGSDRLRFSKALENYTFNTSASSLIAEKLSELNNEKSRIQPAYKNGVLTIDRLIDILNSGDINSKNFKRQFLRDEIIQAIHNKEKRELLSKRLNKVGAELLISLFYQGNQNAFIPMINSFTAKVVNVKVGTTSGENSFSYNELVLNTVLYLTENAIRKLTNEEFVLFLIYTANLDISQTLNSKAFSDFISSDTNIAAEKMFFLFQEERQYPEILNIQKTLSERRQLSQSINHNSDQSPSLVLRQ